MVRQQAGFIRAVAIVITIGASLSTNQLARAQAPTYSLSISGGSFSPSPLTIDLTQPSPGTQTAEASVSGSVVVNNPNNEYELNGDDDWSYAGSISGYKSTADGPAGSVPTGSASPTLSAAPSGDITVTADDSTTAGYYTITITGSDRFTVHDSATDTNIPEDPTSASTQLYLTVATVNASVTSTCCVGQGVTASASVAPSDLIGSPAPSGTFEWSISGTKVAGFTASSSSGHAVQLDSTDLGADSVHFYWVDGGSQTASCSILGKNPSKTADVYSPTYSASPQTGSVNAGIPMGYLANEEGINWTITPPTSPTYTGSSAWVQIVDDTSAVITDSLGQTYTYLANATAPALDNVFPYPILGSGSTRFVIDSPAFPVAGITLGSTANDYVVSSSTMGDTFEDWLMFIPTNDPSGAAITDAIYVPLLKGTWDWSASVSGGGLDGSGNYSAVVGGTVSGGSMSQSTTFPDWSAAITGGSYIQE